MIALSAAEIAAIVGGTVTGSDGDQSVRRPARPPPSSPGRS